MKKYQPTPDKRFLPDYAKVSFHDDGVFRIVYTGSIYAGYRDSSPLFEAVHNLKTEGEISPERFKIIFCGDNAGVTGLARMYAIEQYLGMTAASSRGVDLATDFRIDSYSWMSLQN